MNILCACDDHFLPHTAAMLCSLLVNDRDACAAVRIFLLHSNIRRRQLSQLRAMVDAYGAELDDIAVGKSQLEGLKVSLHASLANYYRLLAPNLLPVSVQKVLYLDSDVIVRKPLQALWEIDLGTRPLAAVEDPGFVEHDRLGISPGSGYFNSGVMLINLAQWREEESHVKVLDFVTNRPGRIKFWDQDGLNAVFAGRWQRLPACWNAQQRIFAVPSLRERYADVLSDPAIVHFSGQGSKPWESGTECPYGGEYLRYRQRTPWRYRQSDRFATAFWRAQRGLRHRARRCMEHLVKSDLVWGGARWLTYVPSLLARERAREMVRRERLRQNRAVLSMIQRVVPDLLVHDGPFRGLRYPRPTAVGSSLAPKLVGTYEAELHDVLEQLCRTRYAVIVNVGCAEGYYAVGLAQRIPTARVYAYDIDPAARHLCREMADINGVSDRVVVGTQFDMSKLDSISEAGRGLLLCDCEGAEQYILHDAHHVSTRVRAFDILVEVHEFACPGLAKYILGLFSETHEITTVTSVDDLLRPRRFSRGLLASEDLQTQLALMAENRPCMMEWFIMMAKRSG